MTAAGPPPAAAAPADSARYSTGATARSSGDRYLFLLDRASPSAARTVGTEGVVAGDVIGLLPRARSGDE